jgi:hypothetical protein
MMISRFRFCHRDDVRFSQFRTEKGSQTDRPLNALIAVRKWKIISESDFHVYYIEVDNPPVFV